MNTISKPQYIIIGAGGHGAVVADILRKRGYTVQGFLDDGIDIGAEVLGAKVLGKIDKCKSYPDAMFIIAIGDNETRKKIANAYPVEFGSAIHPSAIIGEDVKIGRGTVLMAGAIINPRTVVGSHCIINTAASLDHDNIIESYVHISPGVTTGGDVTICENTHVGIGAVIRNGITICPDAMIGAGAVIVKNITTPGVYIGFTEQLRPKH